MEKKIYILSASDRFNYGDLLFPIIAIKELKKRGHNNFSNVAIARSDLSRFDALPTEAYSFLLKESFGEKKKVLLIAGGEVLGANWSRLLSFIYFWHFHIYNKISRKSALEKLTRKFLRQSSNPFPFTPSHPDILNNFEIIFHSVGGGCRGYSLEQFMRPSFSKSIYVSARERLTFSEIKERYSVPDLRLTPDSAMMMSDHFSTESENQGKYLVFQISNYKHDNKLDQINEQLKMLSNKTGLKVVFLPLGNCPGHSDKKALNYLLRKATYRCGLFEPTSIHALMKCIGSSKIYIGTSLHGIITAMSFSVPYLAVNPSLRKLKNYIETWSPSPYDSVSEFSEINENAQRVLGSRSLVLQDNASALKTISSNSFDEISSRIHDL